MSIMASRTYYALLRAGTATRAVSHAMTYTLPRRAMASEAKVAYGAPFTNSISLRPTAIAGGNSTIPGADQFAITLSIPDYPLGNLTVLGRDKLDYVAQQVADKLHAKKVAWVVNGKRLPPGASNDLGESPTLNSVFGNAVELDVDGVRYSINEGHLLNSLGKASKRSLARTYAFIGTGGVLTLVGCLWLWKKIVPAEKQRKF